MSLALIVREGALSDFFRGQAGVSCLLMQNLNDLHPSVVNNPRVAKIKIPFPSTKDLEVAIRLAREKFTLALGPFNERPERLAQGLTRIRMNGLDGLVLARLYK